MKKLIISFFIILGLGSSLYGAGYVRHVISVSDEARYSFDNLYYSYNKESHLLPSPNESEGYISDTYVAAAHTEKRHYRTFVNGYGQFEIYFDVYIPKTSTSHKEYVKVWEINKNEIKAIANERLLDNGNTVSKYKIDEHTYSNGDKIIRYYIPDLSNSDKRIRVTTCPKWLAPTDTKCTHTLAFIKGTAD
ncbi:MAG: hypothetical protein U9N02_04710 [Campylobacterota bacterium]|nr:hypothetical protein [Campylobacterota bacterium]